MSVYKRGKVWWIDYRVGGQRRREAIGPVKDEARIALAERLKDVRQGRNPELRRIDPKAFDEMVTEFKERHVSTKRDAKGYAKNLKVLEDHFKGKTLQEITPDVIQRFTTDRLEEKVSGATVNRNRACLSKLFACAIDWGYYGGENPVRRVRPFKESPGRVRFLTADEATALMTGAADHIKPIILTMLHTGGRVTETLRLRWQDVDLDRGVLYFDQTNTKSGKQREIPLSQELAAMLKERKKVRGIKDVERFLFTWQGKPIERFATAFTTARKRAKLGPDVTPHTCRHTFASAYVINGGDLYRLQRYMGHSTIALTQRYAHLSADYLRAGVEFIGAPRGHKSVTNRKRKAAGGEASA